MTTSDLEVTTMARKHVAACAAIVGQLELFHLYRYTAEAAERQLLQAFSEGRADLLVAESQGEVAGFAWFVPRGAFDRSGYLRLIAVDDRFRGLRVGQQLMETLEQRHLTQGGIVLLASAGNTAAHRFYERLGYQVIGEIPDYVRPGLHERIYFKPAPRPSDGATSA
jgi:ribosomal protein S18 acetylase RimI-like enzyme